MLRPSPPDPRRGGRPVPGSETAPPAGDGSPIFSFLPLREPHLDQVLAIERRLFRTPWEAESFRAFLQGGPALSRVALAGERVAGYALGWCVPPEAELMNLAVDTPWQGRSVGSHLLKWVLAECRRRGAEELFLEVRPSNERARQLYERHGFESWGRRRGYYRNPREDALVLRARLAATRRGARTSDERS